MLTEQQVKTMPIGEQVGSTDHYIKRLSVDRGQAKHNKITFTGTDPLSPLNLFNGTEVQDAE